MSGGAEALACDIMSEERGVRRPKFVSGWITKQGSHFPWSWRRRFATYDKKHLTLSYYDDKEAADAAVAPKGRLKLLSMRR